MPSLMYPSVGEQVLSSLIHFLGVSILSHCLSRKLARENLTSFEGLMDLSWPRVCLLLMFLDSWLFLFSSGVLLFGIGLEIHPTVCSAGMLLCVVFYTTTKLLMYAFLSERVRIVWSPATATGVKRFQSPIYIVCVVTVCAYAVVIGLMFIGRSAYLRESDNVCVVGLSPLAAYPLLIYDFYINIFLTSLFLFPLLRTTIINPRVRRIAKRALIGGVIALSTSTTNVAVVAVLGGHELGWVCLGSCGADIIINALSIFWLTGAGYVKSDSSTSPSTYVNRTPKTESSKPEIRPISILKTSSPSGAWNTAEAYSPTSSQYTSGPHRITNAYYYSRDLNPDGIPANPPAPAKTDYRHSYPYAQSQSHHLEGLDLSHSLSRVVVGCNGGAASACPDPSDPRRNSMLRSLTDRLRRDAIPEASEDIQITVITDIEIDSMHLESVIDQAVDESHGDSIHIIP